MSRRRVVRRGKGEEEEISGRSGRGGRRRGCGGERGVTPGARVRRGTKSDVTYQNSK